MIGIRPSPATEFKKGNRAGISTQFKKGHIKPTGAENNMWKGDKFSYYGVHNYVHAHLPKPDACALCGKRTTTLDLAYKDHSAGIKNMRYSRNLEMWFYLCRLCHMKEDGRLRRLQESNKKRKISQNQILRLRAGYFAISPEQRREINKHISEARSKQEAQRRAMT